MTGNFYIIGINNNQIFKSQILTVFDSLGEKFTFLNPLRFEAKSGFDHETSKIKSHSTKASKYNLNDKNPIHGRETTSIIRFSTETFKSEFSAQNFQADFKYSLC